MAMKPCCTNGSNIGAKSSLDPVYPGTSRITGASAVSPDGEPISAASGPAEDSTVVCRAVCGVS